MASNVPDRHNRAADVIATARFEISIMKTRTDRTAVLCYFLIPDTAKGYTDTFAVKSKRR